MTELATAVTVRESKQVIWEKCWQRETCVRIPFDGRKCASVEACVRFVQVNNSFFLEISLFGLEASYPIGNLCYPLRWGIASIEVCLSNIQLERDRLKSVDVVVKLCVGTRVDSVNIAKCWKVYDSTIRFFHLSELVTSTGAMVTAGMLPQTETVDFMDAIQRTGGEYCYVEGEAEEERAATGQLFEVDMNDQQAMKIVFGSVK